MNTNTTSHLLSQTRSNSSRANGSRTARITARAAMTRMGIIITRNIYASCLGEIDHICIYIYIYICGPYKIASWAWWITEAYAHAVKMCSLWTMTERLSALASACLIPRLTYALKGESNGGPYCSHSECLVRTGASSICLAYARAPPRLELASMGM